MALLLPRGVLIEVMVPVGAAAKRLVRALATPAEVEVLTGRPRPPLGIVELRATHDGVRSVGHNQDGRIALAVAMLDAVDRVAQCARRALPHRRDDLVDCVAVRIDPGLLAVLEDGLERARTAGRVGADAAIVVNGELRPDVVFALVGEPVRRLLPGKSDRGVRPIAVRLVLRPSATAERDRSLRLVLCAIHETL